MRWHKGCLIAIVGGGVVLAALTGFVAVFVLGVFHTVKEQTFGYGYWHDGKRQGICTYVLPEGFVHRQYMGESRNAPRWGLEVFTRNEQQQITFLRTPYYISIDPEWCPVRAIKGPLGPTLKRELIPVKNYTNRLHGLNWTTRDEKGRVVEQKFIPATPQEPVDVHFFDASFYIPFFYRSLPSDDDHTLLFRGFDVKDSARLQTDKIHAWVWYGDFQKLGLDKARHYFLFRPVVLVLEFPERKSGGVAVVKDNKTGETFLIFTTVPAGQKLDQKEFEAFLKTITFDTEPFDLDRELREKIGDRFKTKTVR